MRRILHGLLAVAALLLFAAGLSRAARVGPEPGDEDARVRAIAATVRCPECVGESAADSQAPMARGIRETIREQVRAGRERDEIQRWFVDRYGPGILLEPPARGLGLLLWWLPVAFVPVTLAALAVRSALRRSRRGRAAARAPARQVIPPGRSRRGAVVLAVAVAVAVVLPVGIVMAAGGADPAAPTTGDATVDAELDALAAATRAAPDDAGSWFSLGRALEHRGRLAEAAGAYERAVGLDPEDPAAMFRLAFAHARAGDPDRARPLLREILTRDGRHAEALLLLGMLQHEAGQPDADGTLRRFLDVAGDHPAATGVRRLLDGAR
ncbi:cytochrome c-type biogenesis protein CcmH [Micromonospora sp. WMMD1082]|uniref:cytochrome c-type biogenesis protein CcmH n=1 Tax=Micromonospora sp. WMMD1082 TaxID=3016104 RepID=UPI002416D2EC|nr:cytochrome c-type biogenesis protein CcmH [Micromonospora sp. WMMD1082]MDG4798221.1 cytochrome c-type biogenesis protein CcmH [Micromonospora sp. WMMD1082]